MRNMKCRAYYKPLKKMLAPDQIESINFETKVLGVYIEMDGKGYHRFRMSDFEIMWYTGLQDRNGKDIYEGDILKVPDLYETPENTSMTYHYEVIDYGDCAFTLGGQPIYEDHEYISDECEVIGNIYDNPELLGEVRE